MFAPSAVGEEVKLPLEEELTMRPLQYASAHAAPERPAGHEHRPVARHVPPLQLASLFAQPAALESYDATKPSPRLEAVRRQARARG